jgi:hypothetical protein
MRQEMITDITAGKIVLTPGGAASDIERIWGVASDYDDLYHPVNATSGYHTAQCKHRYALVAVDLLSRLGLPAMEYDTVLYVALLAAQKVGMEGNDPDLTEGPGGLPFPTNLETAARDKAIRAATQAAKDKTMHAMQLQRQLQWEQERVAEEQTKLEMIAKCARDQAAAEANHAAQCKEHADKWLTMNAECQQDQAAKKQAKEAEKKRKAAQKQDQAAKKKRKAAEKQAKEPEKKRKAGGRGGAGWACIRCTFVNSTSASECAICWSS